MIYKIRHSKKYCKQLSMEVMLTCTKGNIEKCESCGNKECTAPANYKNPHKIIADFEY